MEGSSFLFIRRRALAKYAGKLIQIPLFISIWRENINEFQSDAHQREKELVKEAAEFLITHQIPAFVSIIHLSKTGLAVVDLWPM